MDPFHFVCPHCSSRLRVREKLLVGRHIDCPECRRTMLIVNGQDGLGVEPVETKPAAPASKGSKAPAASTLTVNVDRTPDAAKSASATTTARNDAVVASEPSLN